MFSPDIVSLRNFYSTEFGGAVRGLVSAAISRFWDNANGEALLGIGYTTPYLSAFLEQAKPIAALMPAAQGAEYWPHDKDNLTLLAHDSELPFAENSFNRVLLVHSVENSEQLSWMIGEVWRTLTPNGRVLAVVPNRMGMWSRSAKSPFGYGRPFSMAQMRDLLGKQNFHIMRTSSALFIPPTQLKIIWRGANRIEKLGLCFSKIFGSFGGGVLLVEAEKQIYNPIRQPVVEAKQYRLNPVGAKTAITMRN